MGSAVAGEKSHYQEGRVTSTTGIDSNRIGPTGLKLSQAGWQWMGYCWFAADETFRGVTPDAIRKRGFKRMLKFPAWRKDRVTLPQFKAIKIARGNTTKRQSD